MFILTPEISITSVDFKQVSDFLIREAHCKNVIAFLKSPSEQMTNVSIA